MAKKVIHQLIDDLDGQSEATGTMRFSVDGVSYEIDLTDDHQAELRTALAPFVGVAARVGRVDKAGQRIVRTGQASADFEAARMRNGAIRSWFEKLPEVSRMDLAGKLALSDRGRIPEAVVKAFEVAKSAPQQVAVKAPEKPAEAPAPVKATRSKPKPAEVVKVDPDIRPARKRTTTRAAGTAEAKVS